MGDIVSFRSHALWWARVKSPGRYPLVVVVGPRKTGKTTWFEQLAADPGQHLVVWEVIRAARLPTTQDVWGELWQVIGVPAPGGAESPTAYLEECLDFLGHSVTLVVDDWDRAFDKHKAAAGEACYEVLDTLARYCLDQTRSRNRVHFLGLVLVSSVPSPGDLTHFARTVERTTFARLSGLITRSFTVESFPYLDLDESKAVLALRGVGKKAADKIAPACGGWLWLLERAAAAVTRYGAWNQKAHQHVRDVGVPEALESVLTSIEQRPEVQRRVPAIDYLARELADGVLPGEFGLPHDYEDPAQAAPLVRQSLTRTYMAVDTENLRVPFKHDYDRRPDAPQYADGLDAFMQRNAGHWLQWIADKHGIADYDILLVGRSTQTILATVGPGVRGKYHFLPEELREKGKKKESDHTDDTLLTALVAQLEARNRLASFVLVTGDMDSPLILEQLDALRHVTVYTPWSSSSAVRVRLQDEGRLRENTFPVPDPHPRRGPRAAW